MAARRQIRSVIRWVLVGRRDGVRSRVRSALGWFTWLDRTESSNDESGGDGSSDGAQGRAGRGGSADQPSAPSAPAGWSAVLRSDELAPGEIVEVMVGERGIAVARVSDDEWLACDNVCPHAGGPLGDGVLEGDQVSCPWHGYAYDLRSGQCVVDDQLEVETLEVRVEDGQVLVHATA